MRMFLVNETATTQIYTYGHTLYRHDALPILSRRGTAAINGVSPALSVTSTSALALINASTPSAKPSWTASWIGATPRLSRILGLAPRLVRKLIPTRSRTWLTDRIAVSPLGMSLALPIVDTGSFQASVTAFHSQSFHAIQ